MITMMIVIIMTVQVMMSMLTMMMTIIMIMMYNKKEMCNSIPNSLYKDKGQNDRYIINTEQSIHIR